MDEPAKPDNITLLHSILPHNEAHTILAVLNRQRNLAMQPKNGRVDCCARKVNDGIEDQLDQIVAALAAGASYRKILRRIRAD